MMNVNKLDNSEVEINMWDSQNLLTVVLCDPVQSWEIRAGTYTVKMISGNICEDERYADWVRQALFLISVFVLVSCYYDEL